MACCMNQIFYTLTLQHLRKNIAKLNLPYCCWGKTSIQGVSRIMIIFPTKVQLSVNLENNHVWWPKNNVFV